MSPFSKNGPHAQKKRTFSADYCVAGCPCVKVKAKVKVRDLSQGLLVEGESLMKVKVGDFEGERGFLNF